MNVYKYVPERICTYLYVFVRIYTYLYAFVIMFNFVMPNINFVIFWSKTVMANLQ